MSKYSKFCLLSCILCFPSSYLSISPLQTYSDTSFTFWAFWLDAWFRLIVRILNWDDCRNVVGWVVGDESWVHVLSGSTKLNISRLFCGVL